MQLLHLERELVITPKTSVAARNRYVYHKDHLVRMPHPKHGLAQIIQSLWSEPLLHKALPGLLLEFHRPQRPSQLEDESVGAFVSRRLGSHTADNLVSAIAHGIYAGDIYQLSMKSIGRLFWDWEGEFGSMTEGWKCNTTKTSWPLSKRDCDILRSLRAPGQPYTLCSSLDEASQYSFRGGISTLVKTLEREVRKRERVTVRLGSKITEVSYNPLVRGVKVRNLLINLLSRRNFLTISKIASTDGSHPKIKTFDSVVCTLPAKELAAIAKPSLPSLLEIHSVTVMVVNLYYSEPNLLPVHGFGYLIPRSVPVEQNPECALGVVFDSEAVVGLDTVPGTKVTVMLGGHWWDDWWAYPDEEHGARLAKAVLRRHLKIEREPKVVNVTLQKDCIPQYKVGHTKRLEDAHQVLQNGFKGQLKVAGNSYTGVGANDCISAAFIASHRTARQCRGYTGLEYVVDGPRWELFPRNLV